MYVGLNTFNARIKHEGLYKFYYGYIISPDQTHEDAIEQAKDVLMFIKDYNKDKNVLFTCIEAYARDNEELFLNTVWGFAYETEEIRDKLASIMDTQFNTVDGICDVYGKTSCPFRNNNELI